jgi:hypothetical protein
LNDLCRKYAIGRDEVSVEPGGGGEPEGGDGVGASNVGGDGLVQGQELGEEVVGGVKAVGGEYCRLMGGVEIERLAAALQSFFSRSSMNC